MNTGAPDDLSREANASRSRLLRTLEELDRRGHEALDLRLQVRRHAGGVAVAGVVVILAASGLAVLVVEGLLAARHRGRQRWVLARWVWAHPTSALHGQKRPFLSDLLRSVAVSFGTAALTWPARAALRALLALRHEPSPGEPESPS